MDSYKKYSDRASEIFEKSRKNALNEGGIDSGRVDPYKDLGSTPGSIASTGGNKSGSVKSHLF